MRDSTVENVHSVTVLIATSVVRGSRQGESHGGVYLLDLEQGRAAMAIDWNAAGIDWRGRGWDRGLRGIAFDGDLVYIAASDELFVYTPEFERVESYRAPFLKHCHEIFRYQIKRNSPGACTLPAKRTNSGPRRSIHADKTGRRQTTSCI
jgi:hypothetical protein